MYFVVKKSYVTSIGHHTTGTVAPPFKFWTLSMHTQFKDEYILPLFWQHGEPFSVLLEEIEAMKLAHCDGFIVESRPFKDFLEQPWWDTLTFICEEAEKRAMTVWVFDDRHFPSGFVGGRIAQKHPELMRQMFHCREYPLAAPLTEEEKILFYVAGSLDDHGRLVPETARVCDAYPNEMSANRNVFAIVQTPNGGEEHTRTCLNFLLPEAVDYCIREVYEAHYTHLLRFVGKTFRGFFSDEPRFGNFPSYFAILGKVDAPLPWCNMLFDQLSNELQTDCRPLLPLLWKESANDEDCRIRTKYMDIVSRAFGNNYAGRIGSWCRKHNLEYIGHIVEDNGAHCRLGYGPGHYFRSQKGQTWAGVDTVLRQQVRGREDGFRKTQFGSHDDRFFHWGLAKLASSCAHLNPEMKDAAFVEIFGAYGWQEDIQDMKAMADHFLVRGVNRFVPHAFSPKTFPDEDCPPHFYANGLNPQWPMIQVLFGSMRRSAVLLSGGRHVCHIAVLYHAENEWCGKECEPFESIAPLLMRQQLDFDVVDIDHLQMAGYANNAFSVCKGEHFKVLVVPYCQWMPQESQAVLLKLTFEQVPVVFFKEYPQNLCDELKARARLAKDEAQLLEKVLAIGVQDFKCEIPSPSLRVLHRSTDEEDIYFLFNESLDSEVRTAFSVPVAARGEFYDPLQDKSYACDQQLLLAPEQSVFLRYPKWRAAVTEPRWPISFKAVCDIEPICDNMPENPDEFAGVLYYHASCNVSPQPGSKYWLRVPRDCQATVFLNEIKLPPCFASPHRIEITSYLKDGENKIRLEVATTLLRLRKDTIFEKDWSPVSVLLSGKLTIEIEE